MSHSRRLNPRTAITGSSIWEEIPEETFRRHLVALEERTNAVPIRPAVFSPTSISTPVASDSHSLSLHDEQTLADDFAYIAAVTEGAQSVAAVCIEEHHLPGHLHLCFAAADAIDDRLKVGLQEVGKILMLSTTVASAARTAIHVRLLSAIIALHSQKLLGRLRSRKWEKPAYLSRTHKKPLWQDFENLIHRVQHVYPKKNHPARAKVAIQLQRLQSILKIFEDTPVDASTSLLHIIQVSYQFCQSEEMKDFATKLEAISRPTQQVSAALKTLQQVEKIGAYQKIAMELLDIAQTYQDSFKAIVFQYLQPYASVATTIGYEEWARTMHIHAEVQLVIYYDTLDSRLAQNEVSLPRTIGTSKYLCYLCFLFIKYHGRFQPANTHGRLYDQWTVPDLKDFTDENRSKYIATIQSMDKTIVDLAQELGPQAGKRDKWRIEPMTSRQNLLNVPARHIDVEVNDMTGESVLGKQLNESLDHDNPINISLDQHPYSSTTMSSSNISDQARTAQQIYNARAVDYNDSWHPRFAADMVNWAEITPGSRVLDLACGTGLVTLAAAATLRGVQSEPRGHIIAVDIADEMLSAARAAAEKQGLSDLITFIQHDITQLNSDPSKTISESSFDVITCASSLPLLRDPGAAIKHWSRYLRPGGRLVADVLSAESQIPGLLFEQAVLASGASLAWNRGWIKDQGSLERLFGDAGLKVERSFCADGYRSAKGPYPVEDGDKIVDSFLRSPWSSEFGVELAGEIKEEFLRRWQDRAVNGVVDEVEGFFIVIGSKENLSLESRP